MRAAALKSRSAAGARWCAIGIGFTIPISAALDNILLNLFILLWLASGDIASRLQHMREHRVALMATVFGATMMLGLAWSSASGDQLREAITDALRFMVIGLFATVFLDPSTRDRAQFAFLLSSAVVLVLSFAIWAGIADGMPGIKGRADYPVVFKYHITHNVLMAAAAILFALHAMEARNRKARLLFGGLAVAAVIDVFFLIPGRTGQLALALALGYLAIARLRWRGVALAAAAMALLVAVAWLVPGTVLHRGTSKALAESGAWQPGEAQPETSSVGMRLEFYTNALELIGERPIIGFGSGGFRAAYEAKVRGTQMLVADHPHNAFLHIGVELGLIGLAVFIGLLLTQWRSAGLFGGFTERTAARALIVIFVTAGLASSTFMDHAEGLFYAWASGLLFAVSRKSETSVC